MAGFVKVGPADAVPAGQMAAFQVGSRRIAVANIDGGLFAFDDLCTHAACSLSDGDLEGTTVTCPCHMGQFDLTTGEVLDGPPPTPIRVYTVAQVDGELRVEI